MGEWRGGGEGRKIKKKKARGGGVIESLIENLVGRDGGGRKWGRKKRVKRRKGRGFSL